MQLRELKYKRHGTFGFPEHYHGTLLTFVYDIPYFPGCGIFPPLHILNQIFATGGDDGGMSPGTTWKPFFIDQIEYDLLKTLIDTTPLDEIAMFARYAKVRFKFDDAFDQIQNLSKWKNAVCKKHREQWLIDMGINKNI